MPRWHSEKSYFTGSSGSSVAKRRCDVGGHLPSRARIARQSQAPPDANDVRVERHDELDGGHALPDAEIHGVAPDHPAQKQIQPLARAAARRAREEVRDAGLAASGCRTPGARSVCIARVENDSSAAGQVGCARIVAFEKERLDRSFLQHALQDDDERGEIFALRPAVDDRLQIARLPRRDRTLERTPRVSGPSPQTAARSTGARSRRVRTRAQRRRIPPPRGRRDRRNGGRAEWDRLRNRRS